MISNSGQNSLLFGTGHLLDDLIQYVYAGQNCRLLLMGDVAQLPPVMQTESPALNPAVLKGYGLELITASLTEVVRQSQESGILFNATRIRESLRNGEVEQYPKLRIAGFNDLIHPIQPIL